jgi:tetratricopeptide (TPR) repeat protein
VASLRDPAQPQQLGARDPNVPDWHGNLGNVLLTLGRPDEAADAYAIAIHLSPSNAGFLNNLGAVRRAQGRFPEAESAYLKALELDPTRADSHNNLGNLYGAMGRTEQSFKHYCEALVRDPKLYPASQDAWPCLLHDGVR